METLNVSNVQHFSTGDGPGIRTTIFLKGCNLRCPWCHNPETHTAEPVTLTYPNGARTECGKRMTVSEILGEVLPEEDFYRESGGGVTVSGGEALLQPAGVAALCEALHAHGVHTLLDTAGDVPATAFSAVAPFVDTYYFDLKAATAADYAAFDGNFARVTENLAALLAAGRDVTVRIPLIPDFNTAPAYSEAMCETLRALGATRVGLLPFHRLGSAKYRAMGLSYAYGDTPPLPLARAEEIAAVYRRFFTVTIEK